MALQTEAHRKIVLKQKYLVEEDLSDPDSFALLDDPDKKRYLNGKIDKRNKKKEEQKGEFAEDLSDNESNKLLTPDQLKQYK